MSLTGHPLPPGPSPHPPSALSFCAAGTSASRGQCGESNKMRMNRSPFLSGKIFFIHGTYNKQREEYFLRPSQPREPKCVAHPALPQTAPCPRRAVICGGLLSLGSDISEHAGGFPQLAVLSGTQGQLSYRPTTCLQSSLSHRQAPRGPPHRMQVPSAQALSAASRDKPCPTPAAQRFSRLAPFSQAL